MKLLIISNMAHFQHQGVLYGWGPTAQEISHLATLFGHITHIGCLYEGQPAPSFLPYTEKNITFIPLKPTGGTGLVKKIEILLEIKNYIKVILQEISKADVVHVRCPANISLIAIMLLAFVKNPKKRWIKYAGNWQSYPGEALSYKFQKWWLRKNFSRVEVTVNGEWPNQLKYVHAFFNPCIDETERQEAARLTKGKQLTNPLELIFVGRLEDEKGVGRILKIVERLDESGIQYNLHLVGDGPKRLVYETEAKKLKGKVAFYGWLSRSDLNRVYQNAHFILLPSTASEGWPKVLSEAMAYGVVPLTSNVSSIPQYLKKFKTGKFFKHDDHDRFVEAIEFYKNHPEVYEQELNNASAAAGCFTYEKYLAEVLRLLGVDD